MSSNFTEAELSLVSRVMTVADPHELGIVSGEAALGIFQRSHLPPSVLSEIWDLADEGSHGHLTERGVAIAIRLMGWAQCGEGINESLVERAGPFPLLEGFPAGEPSKSASIPDSLPGITLEDAERYRTLFLASGPVAGLLAGEKARDIFVQSELPVEDLSRIWDLADTRRRGSLDGTDFILGMHLIKSVLSGHSTTLPLSIPPQLYEEASQSNISTRPPYSPLSPLSPNTPEYSSGRPQPTTHVSRSKSIYGFGALASTVSGPSKKPPLTWDVTSDEQAFADKYFDSLDTGKKGFLDGEVAANFMLNSKLPPDDLSQIWDLADLDNNNCLTRDGFSVAVHLVAQRLTGASLPSILPPSLLPPSRRIDPPPLPPYPTPQPDHSSPNRVDMKPSTSPTHSQLPGSFTRSQSDPVVGNINPRRTRSVTLSALKSTGSIRSHDTGDDNAGLRSELEKLREELAVAQSRQADLTRENESLASQLRDVEESMAQVLVAANDSHTRNDDLAGQVERLSSQASGLEALQQQLSSTLDLYEDMTQQNQSLKLRLQELETVENESGKEARGLKIQIEGLEGQNELLKTRVREMERLFSGPQSPGSNNELQILIADVTQENGELKKRVRDMEEAMGTLMLENDTRDRTKDLRRANRLLTQRVDELEEESRKARESATGVAAVTRENEGLKARVQDLERRLARQTQASSSAVQLQRRVDELTRENGTLQRQLRDAPQRSGQEDMSVPPPGYDDDFIPV